MGKQNAEVEVVLLDDGEFRIRLNGNYKADSAPGFLERKCVPGVATPYGYTCVGSFDKAHSFNTSDAQWCADVDAIYDPETDTNVTVVAVGVSRIDAIVSLWKRRHVSVVRYQ